MDEPTERTKPDDREQLSHHRPGNIAGGLAAVWSTMKHAFRKMGVLRGTKTLLKTNQKDGFDCPGCAWPDPDDRRAMVEFCENGAKAVADEAMRATIGRDFFRQWSVEELAQKSDHWLNAQGRLAEPMLRRADAGHYEPISWEEAFAKVGSALNGIAPDEAAFYTSGRTSNEAAFLYQLFVRRFGTNNLPDCSNLCHESSGTALTEVLGSGKGTVSLGDFEKADLILIAGQNPGTNHPRMLTTLQNAKRRGCRIISINPLAETGLKRFKHPQRPTDVMGRGTELADLFLKVRVNGDVALFQGLAKALLEAEDASPGQVLDRKFIDDYTEGFDSYCNALGGTSWEIIEESSGVSRKEIEDAADIIMRSKNVICCWAMGLTQHENAVANIQEIVNFLLLRGNMGRPGAGACPVRGHSNVQGDRTMGIWEKPKDSFLDSLASEFGFDPPRAHGHDVVGTIQAMAEKRVKVFLSMGGNFLSASPDTDETAKALRHCDLTVQVSTKLNRSHLVTGREALILPCLGRTERDEQNGKLQFVTVENSMGVVHPSQGDLPPVSEHLKSEPAIVAGLARATFGEDPRVDWASLAADYDRIRESISRVIPGFANYNERVRQGGFYLPHPVRDERRFPTKSGCARFTVHSIPAWSLGEGEFLMMTIRSHDQYNTTIYGLDDRYRGVYRGRSVVFVNPKDMKHCGLVEDQTVDLVSEYGGQKRMAPGFTVVPYDIPRRCVATYFPEANVLVPVDQFAHKSRTPISKSVIVRMEEPAAGAQA